MKLTNIRRLGRYSLTGEYGGQDFEGKEVNVRIGRRKCRGVDVLFYYYQSNRVYIFYSNLGKEIN